MPIYLNEIINEQLYHIIIEGRPEAAEIACVSTSFQPIVEHTQVPLIHFILNLEACQHHPHLGEIYRSLNPFLAQQKLGWFVVYGIKDKLLAFMFNVIVNAFKLRVRHVEDYEDALEFVQSVDLTLGRWSAELIPEPQGFCHEVA
jgi:hypothetical protein